MWAALPSITSKLTRWQDNLSVVRFGNGLALWRVGTLSQEMQAVVQEGFLLWLRAGVSSGSIERCQNLCPICVMGFMLKLNSCIFIEEFLLWHAPYFPNYRHELVHWMGNFSFLHFFIYWYTWILWCFGDLHFYNTLDFISKYFIPCFLNQSQN